MHRGLYRFYLLGILIVGLAAVLPACSGGQHASATAVETFLQALADKNEAQYTTLTCADYELDALLEYDAFSLVKTRLEGLDCQATLVEGDNATVICQGEIVATYGNEDQTFDLSERSYAVINQGGIWLVCGY
jgi:hypothetical protein